MKEFVEKHRSASIRVLVACMVILTIVVLAWFARDRLLPERNDSVEAVTAGSNLHAEEQLRSPVQDPHDELGTAGSDGRDTESGSALLDDSGSAVSQPDSDLENIVRSVVQDPQDELGTAGSDGRDTESGSALLDDSGSAVSQPDLDLESIVREYILEMWGGETPRAESDYVASTHAKLESSDPGTKRRGEFELQVRGSLSVARADDPYYPRLFKSLTDNWDLCLNEYGLPSLEEFFQLTQEQQDALLNELDLVGERMLELEDKCWSQARIYAGKDEETDRLLELQHQYYLSIAQDWVKENPDSVVPLS